MSLGTVHNWNVVFGSFPRTQMRMLRAAFGLAALLALSSSTAPLRDPADAVALRLERAFRTTHGHAVAMVHAVNRGSRQLDFVVVKCSFLKNGRAVITCTGLIRDMAAGAMVSARIGVLDAPPFDSARCRIVLVKPSKQP